MPLRIQLRHMCMVGLLISFVLIQALARMLFISVIYITGNTWHDWLAELLVDITHLLIVFTLPFIIINILGFVLFSLFPEAPKLRGTLLQVPFICFRVVTRGIFPELVQRNVKHNTTLINSVGIEKYMMEVVSDEQINLARSIKTQETVVPRNYSSQTGSMFKARALQYCLEPTVNTLTDHDWIVHLDEETRLTEDSVIGILNFVADGKSHFGQGVIIYTHGRVVNWYLTLFDSIRVAFDYGALRFCLKVLHKPYFNWKGSFIVANVGAERDVSFDHGPEGSISEDCFFGAVAIAKGYRFDFIDGHMCEKSPFTILDYVRQRKRWVNGILLTASSSKIKLRHKFGLILIVCTLICMPAATLINILINTYHMSFLMCATYNTVYGVYLYMYFLGAVKSLSIRHLGCLKYFALVLGSVVLVPIGLILDNIAVVWGMLSYKTVSFHIVQKDYKKVELSACETV